MDVHGADKTRDGEWEGRQTCTASRSRTVSADCSSRQIRNNFISVTEADYITTALH